MRVVIPLTLLCKKSSRWYDTICNILRIHNRAIMNNDKQIARVQKVGNLMIVLRLKKKEQMFRIDIYTFKFQGNCKKICNNFSKFGVPTPSQCGCQLFRTTLSLEVHILTCYRVPAIISRMKNSVEG